MPPRVRLTICAHGAVRVGSCVFCARPYESVDAGVLLWDGPLPRGYVCLFCQRGGARPAARVLRFRARRNRVRAAHLQQECPVRERASLRQQFLDRADDLEGLADRLPESEGWGVEHS